ncbi:MAG: UbiD family decarboxylase domain-containing protein, partial [Phycisphaerae bacterium]
MPFSDLRSYIAELERQDQLRRITTEVDPILEISEIADRVSKSPAAGDSPPPPFDTVHGGCGGHGLLFENVKGSDVPCGINLYGSYQRMRLALGCESFAQLAERVQQLLKPEIPSSIMEKMKKLPDLVKIAGFGPKVVKHGLCQEVVHTDDADLLRLPIIQCWPEDGGRYITFAGIYTKDRESGVRNVGMYRVQVFEPKMTAMHWHVHHDGPRHHRKYKA